MLRAVFVFWVRYGVFLHVRNGAADESGAVQCAARKTLEANKSEKLILSQDGKMDWKTRGPHAPTTARLTPTPRFPNTAFSPPRIHLASLHFLLCICLLLLARVITFPSTHSILIRLSSTCTHPKRPSKYSCSAPDLETIKRIHHILVGKNLGSETRPSDKLSFCSLQPVMTCEEKKEKRGRIFHAPCHIALPHSHTPLCRTNAAFLSPPSYLHIYVKKTPTSISVPCIRP